MFEDKIAVVIPTSPIPSHPDTGIIDAAYEHIRIQLPQASVYILADGVREEQNFLAEKYAQYKQNLREKNWTNTHIVEFDFFHHEAGMLRNAISDIKEPLILYVMHDCLLSKEPIDWLGISSTLLQEILSCVFFCYDADLTYWRQSNLVEQFRNITGGDMDIFVDGGVRYSRTISYTGFPHIATTEFFKFILSHFNRGQIHIDCDEAHEILEKAHKRFRMGVYVPDGDSSQRFDTLDGRSLESVHGKHLDVGQKPPMFF